MTQREAMLSLVGGALFALLLIGAASSLSVPIQTALPILMLLNAGALAYAGLRVGRTKRFALLGGVCYGLSAILILIAFSFSKIL